MKKAYMRFAHDPKEGEETATDSPVEGQEAEESGSEGDDAGE